MRLGIFGGTFDPVHLGHLLLAEFSREQLALDEVWFLPTAVPPHKQHRDLTPAAARVDMLRLAIGGHEAFRVCTYEVDRGGVNYTVDTLAHIAAEDQARELYFLMGADSLRDLHTWREPQRVCELAIPVVVRRALTDGESTAEEVDLAPLAKLVSAERLAEVRHHQVRMPQIDLSATEIRRRLAAGQSIRYQTPRAVEVYLHTHGTYRQASP
jgi:nicotinate-nucleotide adenylyltransferase